MTLRGAGGVERQSIGFKNPGEVGHWDPIRSPTIEDRDLAHSGEPAKQLSCAYRDERDGERRHCAPISLRLRALRAAARPTFDTIF